MNTNLFHQLAALWRAEFLSPKHLLRRALMITILYLAVHLTGLREFASILNGTMGSVELGWHMSAFLGLLYIFVYLAFVLLVPVLVLAAGMLSVWIGLCQRYARK